MGNILFTSESELKRLLITALLDVMESFLGYSEAIIFHAPSIIFL